MYAFILQHRYQLFINTLNPSIDRLCTAVALLDWSVGLKCSTILGKHRLAIDKMISFHDLKMDFDSFTHLYYMTSDKAANLNVRSGTSLNSYI